MKFLSISILCLLFVTQYLSAANLIAKSGSRADIQAQISIAKTGDTVIIPAGTYSFEGSISMKAGISLIGAGQEKTILKRTTNTSEYAFVVDGTNGLPVRISGMTIIGLAPTKSGGVKLRNNPKKFRIDHMTFKKCFDRAIEVYGHADGVIDHCSFIDNEYTAIVVYGDGDEGWKRPLVFGTSDATFIEDCYFEQRNVKDLHMTHHMASNNGSNYVFRYNTVNDGNLAAQVVDAHGNKFYWPRGSRSYEVYNNVINVEHRWLGMLFRGGDGLVYNNEMKGDLTYPIDLMHEGRDGDGNCNYPCIDQIRKLYMWNNTYNGKASPVHVRHPSLIKEGRDYFLSKLPNYVPYTYPHPLTVEKSIPSTPVVSKIIDKNHLNLSASIDQSGITTISYVIPDGFNLKNPIQIRIMNVQGQIVRTLVNSRVTSGMHSVVWNGKSANNSRLANGIYTIELLAGKSKLYKSVTLVHK